MWIIRCCYINTATVIAAISPDALRNLYFKKKKSNVNKCIKGTLTICACEYWWVGKKHTLPPCLALLCKQQTVFLSDIQQASPAIQEEFSLWLLVREKSQENFNASPSHYFLGSSKPAGLAPAFTLVWKASRLPPFCHSQHLQTYN